jgi:ribonuclease HII
MLSYEWDLWRRGRTRIAGIDEAGRGPLAGPVVAAAVVFPEGQEHIAGITDSKKLSPLRREQLLPVIYRTATAVGIGIVSEMDIDDLNILQATYKAMSLAVDNLGLCPDYLLIDGRGGPHSDIPYSAVVKGDTLSLSIAAATIVAKVRRDEIMREYDRMFPDYLFARNKGYPTRQHMNAIRRFGLCPIHRRSFRPKQLEDIYE